MSLENCPLQAEGEGMTINIRTMQVADEETIKDICYVTSVWGRDGKQELRDMIALRWATHYVRHETNHCFAAVDDELEDRVVGYLLCAPDTFAYDEEYKEKTYPLLKEEIKKVSMGGKGNVDPIKRAKLEAEFMVHSTSVMLPKVKKLIKTYPAHIHIDIYPSHHRRGIGRMLFAAHEEHLRSIACPGYHLFVGSSNETAVKFYASMGMDDAVHQVGSIMFVKKV
jgi:ribosomal protein S18 acetylase RimI-like enzyme